MSMWGGKQRVTPWAELPTTATVHATSTALLQACLPPPANAGMLVYAGMLVHAGMLVPASHHLQLPDMGPPPAPSQATALHTAGWRASWPPECQLAGLAESAHQRRESFCLRSLAGTESPALPLAWAVPAGHASILWCPYGMQMHRPSCCFYLRQ